jgi:hypothetical protein
MAEYKSPSAGSDGLSRLTHAFVEAEIELGKDDIHRREASSGLSAPDETRKQK